MRCKVKATGEIVEVERVSKNIFGRTDGIVAMYSKDVLDFNLDPPQPEATIRGWVARDKDKHLMLHQVCPQRVLFVDGFPPEEGSIDLPQNLFPDLTWESDPIEVEIVIKPKKQ